MNQYDSAAAVEVTLGDLWAAISSKRYIIFLGMLVLAALATGLSYLIPPRYSAEVLLSPISDSNSLGGAGAGMAGSLASLAGVRLGGGDSRERVALATLQSRALAANFIEDRNLLPVFFESQWDKQKGAWKNTDPKTLPTAWDGDRYFSQNVRKVTEDKKTGLVTLVVTWKDPEIATEWANDLVARTNRILRTEAATKAASNLKFLERQLERSSIIEVRQAIYRLMEDEIKTLTLAEGETEYAFKVIDPAVVPHRKSSPNRVLFLLGGAIAGLFLGVIYALVSAPPR